MQNMNRDIVALKLIINSSESGDYITGFKELADGSGYTISFSKVVRLSSRMARKETMVKRRRWSGWSEWSERYRWQRRSGWYRR